MMKRTSIPEPSEEKIEEEVVFLIRRVINYKIEMIDQKQSGRWELQAIQMSVSSALAVLSLLYPDGIVEARVEPF